MAGADDDSSRRGARIGAIHDAVTLYRLDDRIVFPPPDHAEPDGLLAVGGDLRPERILLAYSMGIFPWYDEGLPILWHTPDPRAVLRASDAHLPQSLRKMIRRGRYAVRFDTAFREVITQCARVRRPGQRGTWITMEMLDAYVQLFELGFAHSIEAFEDDTLVGGLYGVSLGAAFFGESMFALRPDASKVAFATLCSQLQAWDIDLIDCQVQTEHLERFGAELWPRSRFLASLEEALTHPTRRGPWHVSNVNAPE